MAIRPCQNTNENCPFYYQPPPEQLADQQKHGCFADDHHPDWPASEYTTPIERAYREARVIEGLCRWLHILEHRKPAPEKKTVVEMGQFVIDHIYPDLNHSDKLRELGRQLDAEPKPKSKKRDVKNEHNTRDRRAAKRRGKAC